MRIVKYLDSTVLVKLTALGETVYINNFCNGLLESNEYHVYEMDFATFIRFAGGVHSPLREIIVDSKIVFPDEERYKYEIEDIK